MSCCMCEKYEWKDPQPIAYEDPEGKGYCLFHAPAEHKYAFLGSGKMSDGEFNAQVSERIQETIDLEDDDSLCDLSGTIFPGDICFDSDCTLPIVSFSAVKFMGDVSFNNVHFTGDISFNGAQFEKSTSFYSALFEEGAFFNDAHFGEHGTNFTRVNVGGDSSFDDTKFRGATFWDGATFNGTLSFTDAYFKGGVSFDRANFKGSVCFKATHFEGSVSFLIADFGRHAVDFNRARFEGGTDFQKALFGGDADFSSALFSQFASFKIACFMEDVLFSSATFSGRVSFKATRFEGAALFSSFITTENTILKFSNCAVSPKAVIFDNCNPTCLDLTQQYQLEYFRFIESPWDKDGRIRAKTEDDLTWLQLTRDFYQRMKAKYKAENNEYEASKWHIAEKEAQLKLLGRETRPVRVALQEVGQGEAVKAAWGTCRVERNCLAWKTVFVALISWLSPFLNAVSDRLTFRALWLYKYSSGFGEKPFHALFWLVLLLLLPVLPYVFPGSMLCYLPLMRKDPGDAWVITRLWMVLWQVLVTVQAALFAFALRNRFRR